MPPPSVAIIGSGPSGLASAKAALDVGLDPTVFESKSAIGGLWDAKEGYVWRDMRTNLSKWACCFSDYPWPSTADEFPTAQAMCAYLVSYANTFGLTRHIHLEARVNSARPRESGWELSVAEPAGQRSCRFDYLIAAAGIFAVPKFPQVANVSAFRGLIVHSAEYRAAAAFAGKRVLVVGGSLSGVEISADLASKGVATSFLFSHCPWIIPRYVETSAGVLPLDLAFYQRPQQSEASTSVSANRRRAEYFENTFGNPGDVDSQLRVNIDDNPTFTAVSDHFLENVSSGAIHLHKGRLVELAAKSALTDAGDVIEVDAIVYCTGYRCNLGFLDNETLSAIGYRPNDLFMPFVADKAVFHPARPTLAFVGMYRGPYLGVLELQARWACKTFASTCLVDPIARSVGLAAEEALRASHPRPQFPHGNYIEFADILAAQIGCLPGDGTPPDMLELFAKGPSIPQHYRLLGHGAKSALAREAIKEARERCNL